MQKLAKRVFDLTNSLKFPLMAHFNITIPNDTISFFKELLDDLHFAEFEHAAVNELLPAHKAIVDQRIENYQNNAATYFSWEEVQRPLRAAYELQDHNRSTG